MCRRSLGVVLILGAMGNPGYSHLAMHYTTEGFAPYQVSSIVSAVGLTAYAKDLSTPEEYAATQQQYQMAFMLGGLLSGSLPGLIADYTTSYRGFYIFIAVLTIFVTTVIQRQYTKRHRASVKHT